MEKTFRTLVLPRGGRDGARLDGLSTKVRRWNSDWKDVLSGVRQPQ